MDWRRDALIANLIDKAFDSIKMVYRNAYDVSRLVVHAQDKYTVVGIGDSCQLVGQLIATRTGNSVTPDRTALSSSEVSSPRRIFCNSSSGLLNMTAFLALCGDNGLQMPYVPPPSLHK